MLSVYKPFGRLVAAVLIFAVSALAVAQTGPAPTPTEQSIEHLIKFIGDSNCRFIRNGSTHDSKAAAAHIRMKYDRIRNKIRTPEQFIEYAATRSSLTGEPYYVQCGKDKMLSAEWLQQELLHQRETTRQSAVPAAND